MGNVHNLDTLGKKRRFRDFDDMLRETQYDTVTIRVYGKDYSIPARMPAIIPLLMARHEGDPIMTRKVSLFSAEKLFGDQTILEWTANPDFTLEHLDAILRETFVLIYGPPDAEPEEQIEDDVEKAADKAPK